MQATYREATSTTNLGFLAIHDGPPDRGKPAPQAFLKLRGYSYPTLLDKTGALTNSYDWIRLVNSLPKYILFDRAGRIVSRYGESDLSHVIPDMKMLAAQPN